MLNCHQDVVAYHDSKVTLPEPERSEMRIRRNTNRDRLRKGLDRDGEPKPSKCESQGSYTHRTMVQQSDKDYDIDDGVYFSTGDLTNASGQSRAAGDVKAMVRKALDESSFNRRPKVRTNCVRVYYTAGYHVDIPVYRDVVDIMGRHVRYELASTDWKESDPAKVTAWFTEANERLSPDVTNGRQLRRQVRLLKAFARSRPSWRGRIASGFIITTLIVEECYRPNGDREDCSLYDTIKAIRDRLGWNLRVWHPVVTGNELTKGPDDAQTKFLLEKLDWAVEKLETLHRSNCTRKEALAAWDEVFNTDFFGGRDDTDSKAGSGRTSGGGTAFQEDWTPWEPVDKRGGGRYA